MWGNKLHCRSCYRVMGNPVIETTGETVSEESTGRPVSDVRNVPIYSVARAVEWMKRPENQPKIERAAKQAGEATKQLARDIDSNVSKTWRLLVDISTNEEVENDFINSFLGSLIDDD